MINEKYSYPHLSTSCGASNESRHQAPISMMTRTVLSVAASLLTAQIDALIVGTAMRATVVSRASSSTMLWDPTTDDADDKPLKSHLLQHSEEVVPMYVPPPSGYTKPEDGCEEVRAHSPQLPMCICLPVTRSPATRSPAHPSRRHG